MGLAKQKPPIAVGPLEWIIYDFDHNAGRVQSRAVVLLLDEDGKPVQRHEADDLKPYLTTQEQQQLWAITQSLVQTAYDLLIGN